MYPARQIHKYRDKFREAKCILQTSNQITYNPYTIDQLS